MIFSDCGEIVQPRHKPTLCRAEVGDDLPEERQERGGQGVHHHAEVPHRELADFTAASGRQSAGPDQDSGEPQTGYLDCFQQHRGRQERVPPQAEKNAPDCQQQSQGFQPAANIGDARHQ